MRILCSVYVVNRCYAETQSSRNGKKHVKSTLALCKHPNGQSNLLVFSANNKTGAKYEIKQNVKTILTKFISEGKATIQFKEPPHDLCIQADSILLKQFLSILKKILENKLTPQDRLSSIGITAMNPNKAPTKLVIKSRSQYPIKGFPRTLETLHINDINRLSMDRGILHLAKLKILDLSNNLIEFLPKELNRLPNLVEINMSSNKLGQGSPRQWDWMGGKLTVTLKSLNLSNNLMKYLPQQLLQLHALVVLNVNNNELIDLPSGIGNMRTLRYFNACSNSISTLPGSCSKLKLEELALCDNPLGVQNDEENRMNFSATFPPTLTLCSLKEYAAKKVLLARISYNCEMLPLTLIKFLESAQYCICGEACFKKFVQTKGVLCLRNITKILQLSPMVSEYVPIDLIFCSTQCLARSKRRTLVR